MNTLQPCQSSEVGPMLEEDDRAAYGKRIVATVSQELTQRYGKGFAKSALNRIVKFAKTFPNERIVHAVHAQCCPKAMVKQLVSPLLSEIDACANERQQKSITSFKADSLREFALKRGAVGV